MLYHHNCIYMLYTDDTLLFGIDKSVTDKVIADLKKTGLDLTVEGDIKDFLGVHVEELNGSYTITQHLLTSQILSKLRINEATASKPTPVEKILRPGEGQPEFDKHFDYRSIIGKFLYLEKGTHPDLAYVVHQCARYASNPRHNHAAALRHIGRYLWGMQKRGTIITPDLTNDIELYADADFAGEWTREGSANPKTSLSRSGYTLRYAGCPILWKSKMQTTIALSTAEAEYVALSQGLRDTIPILRLMNEISRNMPKVLKAKTSIKCKVYEDNQAAIAMATSPKVTQRAKHISTKVHHFKQYIRDKTIPVIHIATHRQIADIFTKPLATKLFISLRQKLMGW